MIREAREEAEEIVLAAKVEAATIREAARADGDQPPEQDAPAAEVVQATNSTTEAIGGLDKGWGAGMDLLAELLKDMQV